MNQQIGEERTREARTGCVTIEGGDRSIVVYIGEERIDKIFCVEETAPAIAECMARVLARSGRVDRCELRHRVRPCDWSKPPPRLAVFGRTAAEDDYTADE